MLREIVGLFRQAPEPVAAQLKRPKGRGIVDPRSPGIRQIAVRLDQPTFERVMRVAAAADISTTEALRQLIKRGLDCPHGEH